VLVAGITVAAATAVRITIFTAEVGACGNAA